jgi:hypothetical protein
MKFGNRLKGLPGSMHINIVITLFIITLIFATIQFIYFLSKSTCKKDFDIYDAMMGENGKNHFIPLLFAIIFFGIGIYYNTNIIHLSDNDKTIEDNLLNFPFSINIFGIILSLLILLPLSINYFLIIIKNETFLRSLLIKKGTFSCLLSLSLYSFYNNITVYLYLELKKTKEIGLYFFFLISFGHSLDFIGIYYIFLSLMFKDIIFAVMNFMIYLGMILEFKASYGYIDGRNTFSYIYIIMMIISIISILIVCKKINSN